MTHPAATKILHWYARHGRDLPWRHTTNPYAIWVSEIMLQQTQVETVLPYYRRFLSRFPTVHSLARASLEEVLKAWENMGYYSRARHLHEAAKEIVKRWKGEIPSSLEDLLQLPGVGPYTAAAVASITCGLRAPAVDGNVQRVVCRLFAIQKPLNHGPTKKRIQKLAQELIPHRYPGRFNQGLMDLGALICTPRRPSCPACPLSELCLAAKKECQETLPVKGKRRRLLHKSMAAAILTDSKGRFLVVQRHPAGLLGGLWKFPGGEMNSDETLQDTLLRSVREELGISVRVGEKLLSVDHVYTHFTLTIHVFRCAIRMGKPRASKCRRWQWAASNALNQLPFSRGDRKIMEALRIAVQS
jgi:A/G-specific adenine glycosylase